MRIGLVLPNSNFISRLASDLRRSVEFGLSKGGLSDYELVIETTPYNAVREQIRSKLQDLCVKHEADVVIAPLNPGILGEVEEAMRGQETPLIALSMGEDIVSGEVCPPWIFHNSFNLWRSMWLAGRYTVGNLGPKICSVIAPHEAGYAMNFAFGLGVEAEGGEITATLPIPVDSEDAEITTRLDWALENEPDALLMLGSGEPQEMLCQYYANSGMTVALAGLPPLAYDRGAVFPNNAVALYDSFSSLDPKAPSAIEFIEWHVGENDRPAHAFAILAYETGLLLAAAKDRISGKVSGRRLSEALLETQVEGPRGKIGFDAETQEIVPDQFQLEMSTLPSGEVGISNARKVEIPQLLIDQVVLARKNLTKQGWVNPYLIA